MKIPLYLALSSADFAGCSQLPPKVAWMACHFSPGGNGLTNLPSTLPKGSLLIFDDSTPYHDHDCGLILSQLFRAVEALDPVAILLDFQRPDIDQVRSLVDSIIEKLPCPVAVSSCYAENPDCPVFLPPGPLWQPLKDYLAPYQGREIWLDTAPTCAQIVITAEQSQYLSLLGEAPDAPAHFDSVLHCHYTAKIEEDRIIFTLSRQCEDLVFWLEEAETLGVTCAVGLYQELSEHRFAE